MTNGVSFSLVAGACCIVYFSNIGSSSSGASISTLNINSTGAISVEAFNTGHMIATSSQRVTATVLHKYTLVIYSGSKYGIGRVQYYADYNDDN